MAAMVSLGMVALLIVTLIAMGALDTVRAVPAERLIAVRLSERREPEQQQQRQKAVAKAAAPRRTVAIATPRPVIRPALRPTPRPVASRPAKSFIPVSKADFEAGDISQLLGDKLGAAGPGSGSASNGPGDGPGGARMYNAEWYREPSHAEISGYLGKGAPPGSWGMIACKTAENFRVEDCVQLGESPPGSGLSRALRQAAWQFLIRPPQRDGKPQIGAWVRIRFDFTKPPPDRL